MMNKTFSIKRLEKAAENYEGFCVACGKKAKGVEPDAQGYECAGCGAMKVYGAEELILMDNLSRY